MAGQTVENEMLLLCMQQGAATADEMGITRGAVVKGIASTLVSTTELRQATKSHGELYLEDESTGR